MNKLDIFIKNGIIKFPVDINLVNEVYSKILNLAIKKTKLNTLNNNGLENFHKKVPIEILNDTRMFIYAEINKHDWILKKMMESLSIILKKLWVMK